MKKCTAVVVLVLTPLAVWSATGPELGDPSFRPSPDHPVGFRGDWTGRYPGATPPVSWNLKIGHNVLYSVKVGDGESSPVVVGDRVFILTDACQLHCLDRADGRVLWTREHHADKSDAKFWELEEYGLLHHQMKPFRHRIGQIDGLLKKESKPALVTEREELLAKLVPLQAAQGKIDLAKWGAAKSRMDIPQALIQAMATVCSDGQRVIAYLPSGAVVCYDLDGKRLWFTGLGGEKRVAGDHCYPQYVYPSPLLVAGRVVVEYDQLYCLDANDGKVLWTGKLHKGLRFPSPVPGKVGDTWYIGTGDEQVYRLADGKLVGNHGPQWPPVGSMIFHDGGFNRVGFFIELPAEPNGATKLRWSLTQGDVNLMQGCPTAAGHEKGGKSNDAKLWGHHEQSSCIVYDRGRFFFCCEHGEALSAMDAMTGKHLGALRSGRRGGSVYNGLALAGGIIYTTGDGASAVRVSADNPPQFQVLGGCSGMPTGGNHLFFHGSRAFIHRNDNVICVGDPLAMEAAGGGAPDPERLRAADARDRRTAAEALLQAKRTGPEVLAAAGDQLTVETDELVAYALIRLMGACEGDIAPWLRLAEECFKKGKVMRGFTLLRAFGPRAKFALKAGEPVAKSSHVFQPVWSEVLASVNAAPTRETQK